MISDRMTAALNKQINAELYSGYLYLAMSAQASDMGLGGVAGWFFVQYQEEEAHAHRLLKYVLSQGARVLLDTIEKPQAEYASVQAMFEETLAHEKKVTGLINGLVDLAIEDKDHATQSVLKWFVDEQVEEEESASDIIAKFALAGDHGASLLMLDRALAARQAASHG